jgi:pimeloyl-ACP methyl ester carboxylesterase
MATVNSQGTDIHYTVVGDGPPVLLIAGTGYAGTTWHPGFLSQLAERATVVYYDHRGTGETKGTPDDYDIRLFARDAAAVIRALGGDVHVVGHSMGGRVAQWLAIDSPELVRSLVLVSSGAGAEGGDTSRVGIPIAAALGLAEDGYRAYIARLQRSTFFTDAFAAARPDEVEWLADAFWRGRPALLDYLKHVRARQAHSSRPEIRTVRKPTLVLVGAEDTHVGGTGSHVDQSIELHELIAGSRLTVLPGVKHGLFWERPEETAEIIADWCAGGWRE